MSNFLGSTPIYKKSGVSREVLKWIQSLDLTYPVKNFKRCSPQQLLRYRIKPILNRKHTTDRGRRKDFSNGFLIAEMFSWYFPKDIEMHSYNNGSSLPAKLGNWSQLERFFVKRKIEIPKELIDGTLHCKPGAAELFIQSIYSILTNREVRMVPDDHEIDFTDRAYQVRLPMHARSTAALAIKNNIKITECMTEPNINTNKQKANAIIMRHVEHRNMERIEDPKRFNIKPTLGQLAERIPPHTRNEDDSQSSSVPSPPNNNAQSYFSSHNAKNKPQSGSVRFREVQVQQMNKNSQMSVKPGTIHTVQTPVLGH